MSSATDSEAFVNAFINTIHPSFNYTVANTAFSASLFTLCIFLFALSTKESRRRVVFRLNVFAICIVLVMGVLIGLTNGKAIIDPFNPLPTSVYIAGVAFLINNYITIMGVLCATLRFSGSEWVQTRKAPLSDNMFPLSRNLRRVHDAGKKSRSDIMVVGMRSATPDTADVDGRHTDRRQSTTLAEEDKYRTV
ncbi:hypothetical protein EV401DRAFT_2193118 [Pisolithus croceorrhizus]|nr:hypothetical protein EV401DRAFT_2193118 [Pisolithus croceorrhizus]